MSAATLKHFLKIVNIVYLVKFLHHIEIKKTTSVVTDESLVIQNAKSSVPLTEFLTNLFIFLVTLFSSTPCV